MNGNFGRETSRPWQRRKLSCKVCGEKWHGRQGPVYKFYARHEELHNLTSPHREEGEADMDFIYRLEEWRRQYFDDSNLEVTR